MVVHYGPPWRHQQIELFFGSGKILLIVSEVPLGTLLNFLFLFLGLSRCLIGLIPCFLC